MSTDWAKLSPAIPWLARYTATSFADFFSIIRAYQITYQLRPNILAYDEWVGQPRGQPKLREAWSLLGPTPCRNASPTPVRGRPEMRSDHDDASSARRIRGFLVGVKYGGNKSSLFAHSLADGEGRGTADPGAGGGRQLATLREERVY